MTFSTLIKNSFQKIEFAVTLLPKVLNKLLSRQPRQTVSIFDFGIRKLAAAAAHVQPGRPLVSSFPAAVTLRA